MLKFDPYKNNPYFAIEPGYLRNYVQKLLMMASPIFIALYLNNLLGWTIGWFLAQSRTCNACIFGRCGLVEGMVWKVGSLIPNVSAYFDVLHAVGMPRRCFLLGFSHGYYLLFSIIGVMVSVGLVFKLRSQDRRALAKGEKVMPVKPYPRAKWMLAVGVAGILFIPYIGLIFVRSSYLGYSHYPVVMDEYFSAKAPAFFFALISAAPGLIIPLALSLYFGKNQQMEQSNLPEGRSK